MLVAGTPTNSRPERIRHPRVRVSQLIGERSTLLQTSLESLLFRDAGAVIAIVTLMSVLGNPSVVIVFTLRRPRSEGRVPRFETVVVVL